METTTVHNLVKSLENPLMTADYCNLPLPQSLLNCHFILIYYNKEVVGKAFDTHGIKTWKGIPVNVKEALVI